MTSQRWVGGLLAVLLLLVSSLGAVACGDDEDEDGGGGGGQAGEKQTAIRSNPDNEGTTITVGSKNFTEQKVLGEIYAQSLAAAGYKVETEFNLGDEKTALKALESNEISAYPEYTGTALGSFFGVKSNEIPKDEQQAFRDAKAEFAKKNLTAFPPTPFTSSNEVAVTKKTADEEGLEKISDLADKDEDLSLYGSPECRQREDCLLGLQRVYGLDFKEFKPVAIDLRHEVLRKGQADVSIVFTTDPQIQRNDLVLLEDDKGMFPPFNSTLVVRDDVVRKAGPDLAATAAKASKGLTDEVMQELNARVDLDKKTPKQVASEYLKEAGLVK
jgi:osmoprotectant transport system substrate-binding protein